MAADGTVTSQLDLTWQEWLRDPARGGYDLSRAWPAQQVLQLSEAELVQEIAEIYAQLFPLILLATLDDPIPAIGDYLGLATKEDSELNEPYPLAQCAQDTGLQQETLARWVRAIERKGQAVLYGPPGTGKTCMAERLADHLIGGGDGFAELVQFHPAYVYVEKAREPHSEIQSALADFGFQLGH